MLSDEIDEPGTLSPEELHSHYQRKLATAIHDVGVESAAAETGLDEATVQAVAGGDDPDLTLEDAAGILAAAEESTTRSEVLIEVRDHLLLQMTTAVLDVDTIAADIDADLTAKEIQQKIEGRTPMMLREYALLHQYIASEADA